MSSCGLPLWIQGYPAKRFHNRLTFFLRASTARINLFRGIKGVLADLMHLDRFFLFKTKLITHIRPLWGGHDKPLGNLDRFDCYVVLLTVAYDISLLLGQLWTSRF